MVYDFGEGVDEYVVDDLDDDGGNYFEFERY